MVSDTSLTTWNGLTQPACFSSHHFRWHFSLHLSVLYIQHSVKWFLEPPQPHQPCGGGDWAGGSSGVEKATACPRVCMCMHYRSCFSHPASVKGILKVPHQPFFAFQSSAPSGSDSSGSAASPLEWPGMKASCCIPVSGRSLWSRWCLCRHCSAPSSSPAHKGRGTAPCVPQLHPPSRHNPHTQPLLSWHTPLTFPLLSPAASQQRTYHKPHLLNELKAVASAQNLPSPSQLPPLSNCIISITPTSPQLPDCCWNGWGNFPFQIKEQTLSRTSLFPPLFCQKWCFW